MFSIAYKYCKLAALLPSCLSQTAEVHCCIVFIDMDTSQFSDIAKTHMVLKNSQRIFVDEEYFKTKSSDLCSEGFELKFPKYTKEVNSL